MNEDNKNMVDVNFFNIVMSLSQASIMYMGKISNPQTGKVEKNLKLAKANIDILQMLQEKTKGNLTKKENEVITENLTNLQLTYADEKKKEKTQPEAEETKEETKEPSGTEDKKEGSPEEKE